MSRFRRWAMLFIGLLALPLAFGVMGWRELSTRERPTPPPSVVSNASRPELDPEKKTVVVLLGADVTEVTDALGPYEMFARAQRFNVVTAAPQRRLTLLSGGLRIMPHYSLSEVDAHLEGKAPPIIVVPNIPNIASSDNAPIVTWLRKQAASGALLHSWCTGAMALAHAGLLDGRTATAHWGDIPRLEKRYPRVRWVRGVRWVDHGAIVMSAGITSGIDASLRVIARLSGETVARRVAKEIRYPDYRFVEDPVMTPYSLRPADTIVLANAAWRFGRTRIGVGLYDGVGELDLSNIYDAHAYTFVADVESVAEHKRFVTTAHGLTLLPSIALSNRTASTPKLDRFVIPGPDARAQAASLVAAASALHPEYLHADRPDRFGLEQVLEDLAQTSDNPTARLALRRMEYRSASVRLDGSEIPWRPVTTALLLAGLGAAVTIAASHAARLRGGRRSDSLLGAR